MTRERQAGDADGSTRELIECGLREAEELLESLERPQLPSDAIAGYRILDEIGRGGMGVVYRALQIATKRIVAVKVMLAGAFASQTTIRRFHREIELAARFQHPGIVRVLESGTTSTGQPYYAMDYVDGVRLDCWLRAPDRDTDTILAVLLGICEAVAHAHAHGVIHRDLKPANVLIDADGRPHILDFGLSKSLDPPEPDETLTRSVTCPGHVMGTLPYLAPEQAASGSARSDARSDVYALGVVLFEALTGQRPYPTARSPDEWIRHIHDRTVLRPSSVSDRIDGDLETIILKALESEPDRRYPSAVELAEDIRRYRRGEPILARPPSSFYIFRKRIRKHRGVVMAAGVCIALVFLGWLGRAWYEARRRSQARWTLLQLQVAIERGAGNLSAQREKASIYVDQFPDLVEAKLIWSGARFRAASQSGELGLIDGVVDTLLDGRAHGPAAWAFTALLAEVYRDSGRAGADRLAREADRETPATAEASYIRSFATLDPDVAYRWAQRAVQLDPNNVLALWRLAYLAQLHDDTQWLFKAVVMLAAAGEDGERILMFRAEDLMRNGQYAGAIYLYSRVLAAVPSSNALRFRAVAYLCQRKYKDAIRDYTEASRGRVAGVNWVRYQRATPLWITGCYDRAAADYDAVRTQRATVSCADVRLVLVLEDKARFLRRQGRAAEARQADEKAASVLKAALRCATEGSWEQKYLRCLAGTLSPAALVAIAAHASPARQCEAAYYAGEACLLRGEQAEALRWFQQCVAVAGGLPLDPESQFIDPMNEYHLALWRVEQLRSPASSPSP